LGKLSATVAEVESAYDEYQFYRANQALVQLANMDLSAFYLDISKDRLYISAKDDVRRRSCQTVLKYALEQMAVMMSPIVPHMAEDVWQNIPYSKTTKSVFEKGWVKPEERFAPFEEEMWSKLRSLRNDVNRCIEVARQAKEVGASQEARVVLHCSDPQLAAHLMAIRGDDLLLEKPTSTNMIDDLRFVFITSQIKIVSTPELVESECPSYKLSAQESESGLTVGVAKAIGKKCERCWYYSESVGHDHDHSDVCQRCASVIREDKHTVPSSPAPAAAV